MARRKTLGVYSEKFAVWRFACTQPCDLGYVGCTGVSGLAESRTRRAGIFSFNVCFHHFDLD